MREFSFYIKVTAQGLSPLDAYQSAKERLNEEAEDEFPPLINDPTKIVTIMNEIGGCTIEEEIQE
jgi:hypothetical protein